MMNTVAIVLIVLWLLGLLMGYSLGGWIHVLLVVAIIVVAMNMFGKKGGTGGGGQMGGGGQPTV